MSKNSFSSVVVILYVHCACVHEKKLLGRKVAPLQISTSSMKENEIHFLLFLLFKKKTMRKMAAILVQNSNFKYLLIHVNITYSMKVIY